MYKGLHVKYQLFLSDCNETNFADRFSKNTQISHFSKFRQVYFMRLVIEGGGFSSPARANMKFTK